MPPSGLQRVRDRFLALSGPVRGGLWMTGFCLTFAGLSGIVRHLSGELHPFETAFFRNAFGLVFMLPFLWRLGSDALKTERFGLHLFRSLSGIAAMMGLFTALSVVPLATVTALTFTAPLFATVGAALVLGEVVRARRWAATLIGFAGTLVIVRPGMETLQSGALIALVASFFIATSMLAVKALSSTENPNTVVLYMGVLMTPLSLIPAAFVWTWPAAETWPWLAAMGFLAALGQIFMTRAFGSADASVVVPFDFGRLVFVALVGFFFFAEATDIWTWIGAAVIFSSSVYIARRESQAVAKPVVAADGAVPPA